MKLLLEKTLHLRTLYVDQIRSMLSAEEQIAEGLEKLQRVIEDQQLRQAFQSQLQDSEEHVGRLRRLLNQTAGRAEEKKCKVADALFDEAVDLVEGTDKGPIRDAALISAAQRVKHYQIAVYGALRSYAQFLELAGDTEAFDRILHEVGHADELLTRIAERVAHEAFRLG
jgi:ferritin-like metal-binding protein YciE